MKMRKQNGIHLTNGTAGGGQPRRSGVCPPYNHAVGIVGRERPRLCGGFAPSTAAIRKTISRRSRGAFTMLEMLTVLTIIAVLAGLLFPMIKKALERAETAKAQQGVTSLATAFKAYYTEYGKWPIADTVSNNTYTVDANMVMLLRGVDVATPPFSAPVGVATALFLGNPRQIVFLEFKQADIDGSGNFVDPWRKPYYFRLDVSYANNVQDPFTSGNVTAGFLIWSAGADGQAGTKDDVKSW